MAVDKNSKAYKGLLESGYTDEEIMEMHDAMAGGQTASEVMGKNNTSTSYDPMADLTPEYLENMDYGKEIGGANQSFSQYGDDSSPDYQNKSKGGLNDKYSGEGVKNDQVNYDANLMLKDLNPNFVYGLASKVYGTDHPGYITQRNDQIASALYNEGKTSKDDVAYFLGQQKGWMNSSEADRGNTIEAIYKRLGAIAEQNPKEEEKPDLSKADNLVQDTSGKIYGKTTAEEGEPSKGIDTLADANSVFTSMQESRAANLKSLVSMSPSYIANVLASGVSPYSEQTLRDARLYYPEYMAEVQTELKRIQGGKNANSISKGDGVDATGDLDASNNAINDSINSIAENTSNKGESEQAYSEIQSELSNNATASNAKERMESIYAQIQKKQKEIKGLREEANKIFKGDAPDYLVNAYINNRTQEINKQIDDLKIDYNAANVTYSNELAEIESQRTAQYRQDTLSIQREQLGLDRWYKEQQIAKSNLIKDDNGNMFELKQSSDGNYYLAPINKGIPLSEVTSMLNKEDAINTMQSAFAGATSLEDIAVAVSQIPNNIKGGQCGFWANNVSAAMGSNVRFGNSLDSKINPTGDYTKSKTPVEGSFVVFNSKTKPGNGHVGFVIRVNPDGSFVVKSSNNSDGGETIFEATYKNADSALTFIVPKINFSSLSGGQNYENPIDIPNSIYEIGTNADGSVMTVDPNSSAGQSLRKKYLESIGLTEEDYQNSLNSSSQKKYPSLLEDYFNSDQTKLDSADWNNIKELAGDIKTYSKMRDEYLNSKNTASVSGNISVGDIPDDYASSSTAKTTVELKNGKKVDLPLSYFWLIWQDIPIRTKDNVEERKDILSNIGAYYDNGYSKQDAYYAFKGALEPNAPYARDAIELYKYIRKSPLDTEQAESLYPKITLSLENGDEGEAMATLENAIFKSDDDAWEQRNKTMKLARLINDFYKVIDEISSNKDIEKEIKSDMDKGVKKEIEKQKKESTGDKYFGILDVPLNEIIRVFNGNPEYTTISSTLNNIYTDIYSEYAGRGNGNSVPSWLDNSVYNVTYHLGDVGASLNSLLRKDINDLNVVRHNLGLPELPYLDNNNNLWLDLFFDDNARANYILGANI